MVRPGQRAQTVQQLIDQLFQVSTEQRDDPLLTTATTTVQQFLRASPGRIAFTVTNLGVNPAFLWSDRQVATSRGLRAGPNGGSVTVIYDQDFSRVSYEWWIVTSGGSSAIATQEVLIGS